MFERELDTSARPNRTGKEREWDGRGSGVPGWNTESESDVWEFDLDFKQPDEDDPGEPEMDSLCTSGEMIQLRYVKAEKAKEKACHASPPAQISLLTRSAPGKFALQERQL